ncbi:PHA/PHB synthase family protein [Roseospira navarrensis]|uniref:Class I poly(R)-hydroxyalkanoic acid synthase n=1 Tax=Roseospira navarrensis TaxID=140058 RepID=A0A7X2D4W2_9PROT|nr:class I poly(R)-hydroxyalkanoic acid synthase [Roseospira navarrensis]MQX37042.1 class I poly(R)-hydroxyalkanoic acid synthase [Roseospira navarrensis]
MTQEISTDQWARYGALVQRAQRLFARAQERAAAKATGGEFSIVDLKSVNTAFMKAWADLAQRPADLVAFQQNAWLKVSQAWWTAWTAPPPEKDPAARDRRFRDPGWTADPFSRALRDAHLALEDATQAMLETLPKGTKEQLRVHFYTRQILSALSPSNMLALNPAARARFLETGGESLLDGLENLLDDLDRGDGRLDIATNDPTAFVVGRDLATTPGKVVFQNTMMQLIQYQPRTETQHARPLLFVPPWINKYYIFDMRAKNSLVRYALDHGHTVFVISWVNPGSEHADKGFDAYMTDGPLAALEAIEQATGARTTNILGFCIGGILVTATLAYLAARGEADRIGTATTLATMVDFTDVGEIGVFIDNDRVKVLREHMKETGYLENHHLQDMFSMIRENDLVWSFHVMNYLMGRKPPAFDLLFWNSDSTRLPAAMLTWYLEKIYIENGLRQPGYLSLNGTPIDLHRIETPFFVLATKEDHIAPWRSVYPTTGLLSGEVLFVLGGSGHIAGAINPPADPPKYGYWTRADHPDTPEAWLSEATYTEGSWWPLWADWLAAHNTDARVPARTPGDGALSVIEDAPGAYVMMR